MLRFLLVLSFLAVRCDGFVPRLGFRVGQSPTLIASTTERPQSSASSSSDGEDFVKVRIFLEVDSVVMGSELYEYTSVAVFI